MSERQIRRMQKRWQTEDENATQNALKALLGVAEGRRYLYLQLVAGGYFASPFVNNALVTAYNSGRHSVAIELANSLIAISPDLFSTLIKESQRVQENRIQEAAMGRAGGGNSDEPGDSPYHDVPLPD